MREEYELVKHPHLNHVNLFLVDMEYRAPHLHREFEMDWIVAGEASFIIGNTPCPVQTGSVILLNPNQLHEIKTQAGPITILSLQLSPKFFAGAVPGMDTLFFDAPLPMNVLPQTLQNGIQDRLLRLAAAYFEKAPYFEPACMSILADLIHFCLLNLPSHHSMPEPRQVAQKRAERIRRIIDFANDSYTGKTRLQDLARKEGLTLNYLSAFVKENLNMTFQEYLAGLRLNQAKKLLLSEDKSLLTVSLESGFSDPRYLTRAFLAQMGITPCEYRKRRLRLSEEDNSHRSPASSERFYSDQEALRRLVQK